MSRSPTLPSRPLQVLLHLEWILLAIVALSELATTARFQVPRLPLLNLISLGIFTLMGLQLPTQRLQKVLYTGLEFGLILFASIAGGIRLFPFLYLVLVIRNCFIFEQRDRSVVAGITFVLCIATLIYRFQSFGLLHNRTIERPGFIWFSVALLFGLVVVFLQLLVNAVLSERRSREQLATAHEQLRQYALRTEELATLQERNRIARDIHDSLGHSLTVFNLHLEAALRLFDSDPDEVKELLLEAKQLGATALQDVRQSVATLRSDPLKDQPLESAIATLVDEFHRSTGITPKCDIQLKRSIPDNYKITAYRIVQEALTNICKYADTSEVTIAIHTNTYLHIMVQDNGKGFDRHQSRTGFGLQGMQERTLALSGHFELHTSPGQGCQIIATIPLNH